MLQAADRMRSLGKSSGDAGAPASIFGSAVGLAQSISSDEQFRISVYPILCEDMPDVAMGLAACLCYLIEQYPDTRVYRCFAKIDPADDGSEIRTEDYQFTVADWEFDGLADNVVLDGSLRTSGTAIELRLSVDSSLSASAADDESLIYSFDSLAEAAGALPAIALDVYRHLAADAGRVAVLEYEAPAPEASVIGLLLESVFAWSLDVYLYLWGVDWAAAEIQDQYLEFASLCEQNPCEFAFWCLGMMTKQVMQPGISQVGETLKPLIERVFPPADIAGSGVAAAALGLSQLGLAQRAVDLLAPYTQPQARAGIWRAMIDIRLAAGQFAEAIDTCQLALEGGLRQSVLYWRYAQLLMSAEVHEWPVEDVLLIDPDEYDEDAQLSAEIANALKLYLSAQNDDLGALQLALSYMLDAADDELWIYFERLVQADQEGIFAGEVLDRICELDDHERAYALLEEQLDSNPYSYVYLAQLALTDGDAQYAADMIAACRDDLAEIDEALEFELQGLALQATYEGIEEQLAETKVILNANRPAGDDVVDLLEQAIELAPKLLDLRILLARCYRSWKDDDSALEVLGEAEQQAGPAPEIDLGMAQILWARNEREAAVARLNRALQAFPSDVSLLAQLASYLIENDQFDDARQLIARAETISPSHQAVWHVRRLVAAKLAQ